MSVKIYKIVVIDKGEEVGYRINELLRNIPTFPCVVKWFPSLVIEEVKDAYCVIIDSRLVKDVKNLIEVLTALSVTKVIITTSELNSPLSSTVLMMGASLFYRNSPVTTILPKIIDNFKEKKMPSPIIVKKSDNAEVVKKVNINLSLGKSIFFYSPKGGTGKTSILLNIASSLAIKNAKVLVIDYSLFGNIKAKLKIVAPKKGLSEILSIDFKKTNPSHLDDIIKRSIYTYQFLNFKFDLLTSDSPLAMTNINIDTVENINNVINSLNYDIILIDSTSHICPLNTALFEMSKEILLISSPDICSTWSLLQLKEIIHHLNITKKCKLVLNMNKEIYKFNTKELIGQLRYELVSIIPDNPKIKTLENNNKLICQDIYNSFNIHYKKLAQVLIPVYKDEEINSNDIFTYLSNLLKKK